jgi:transposase
MAGENRRKHGGYASAVSPVLRAFVGISVAELIGQTAGAARFARDPHFARTAGVAPIPVSSGRHDRHRLDHGGKSSAQPGIARHRDYTGTNRSRDPRLPRAQGSPGQEPVEAMRCLKRYLARHYHRLLQRPPGVVAHPK